MQPKSDIERQAEMRASLQAKFLPDGNVLYGKDAAEYRAMGTSTDLAFAHPEKLTAEQLNEASKTSQDEDSTGKDQSEEDEGNEETATLGKEGTRPQTNPGQETEAADKGSA
jgi:hypothetical protein